MIAVHEDDRRKMFPTTPHSVIEKRQRDPYLKRLAEWEANAHSYSKWLSLALRNDKSSYVQDTDECT